MEVYDASPLSYLLFCARFLEFAFTKIRISIRHHKVIAGFVGFFLVIPPLRVSLGEYWRFLDPIYYTRFYEDISRMVKETSIKGNRVYWWGAVYPLFPKEDASSWPDRGFYLYHFDRHAVYFLSGVSPQKVRGNPPFFCEEVWDHLFLKSGDLCLISPISTYRTETISTDLPFIAIRIERVDLLAANNGSVYKDEDGRNLFALLEGKDGVTFTLVRSDLKDGNLYIIDKDGVILAAFWTLLHPNRGFHVKGICKDKIERVVIIAPLVEAIFYPNR
jgi:hypothetical protein